MADRATETGTDVRGDGRGPSDVPAVDERAELSNYEIVRHYFAQAAERLGLRDDIAAVLRSSYREVQVQIPVKLSDGKIHVYAGYRVQHNGARGPYEGGVRVSPAELLEIDCDVFVPAALGGMIHKGNADRLSCRMMVEGANSPTTPAAHDILTDKGVFVVPDLMANAGGVVVSYFEWVQNLQHFRWDEREVNDRLGRIMRKTFREVSARAREADVSLRIAAYELGIERVVEAATIRGY